MSEYRICRDNESTGVMIALDNNIKSHLTIYEPFKYLIGEYVIMKIIFENPYIRKEFDIRLALFAILLLPVVTVFLQSNAFADPTCTNCSITLPPTPSTWKVNGNGYEGILTITSNDSQGNIKGTIYNQQIFGFYDARAGKITFMRMIIPSDPFTFQVWTGHIFEEKTATGVPKWTFDGYFQAFLRAGGIPERNVFGWQAETSQVEPPDTTIISALDQGGVIFFPYATPLNIFRPENSNYLRITFTGTSTTGISGFECSLNRAAPSPCSSPITYSSPPINAVPPGHNEFEVTAVDTLGNKDPTPATFSFNATFG